MRLDVAFLPRLLRRPESCVCLLIDALRASSSIVTLFARGAEEVVVAGSATAARRIAAQEPGRYLLCGEVLGLAPRGFDYGNSPVEFAEIDMRGHRIILSTTNGTKALRGLAASPAVFVGALLNATSAIATLLAEARSRGLDAALVCSGLEAGSAFSLEDAFVAGALVENAVEQTRRASGDLTLSDAALAACRLYQSYQGDALACFREAEHGRSLIGIGLGRDLEFCARVDLYDAVPRLRIDASGRLSLAVNGSQT
ncbi:MAG TPA: 2-phosphosulfolactate phosphatase [Dehalococcoidia bacterium]|nr:2-phosphosulfolactate phosphatase [Thermoleophilia bacterium]HUS82979.1 2-phosphosulfolactate phosphatase [Dehalococcoidia bacterium]